MCLIVPAVYGGDYNGPTLPRIDNGVYPPGDTLLRGPLSASKTAAGETAGQREDSAVAVDHIIRRGN
jgi:hypothetical protein